MTTLILLQHFAQAVDITTLPKPDTSQTVIKTILSVVFSITGAISVIMVTIGGIKYAGSQGDPGGTAKAKDTIIYAVVGVVISIFAVTIVQITIGKVVK